MSLADVAAADAAVSDADEHPTEVSSKEDHSSARQHDDQSELLASSSAQCIGQST